MNKSFEKIRERLQKLCEKTYYNSVDGNRDEGIRNNAYHNAIDIINQVEAEYNNGWIACNEMLPDDGVDVLVWFEYYRFGNYNRLYQTIGISYTYNGKWSGFVNGTSGWKELRIIAWQPLPQPPKGE